MCTLQCLTCSKSMLSLLLIADIRPQAGWDKSIGSDVRIWMYSGKCRMANGLVVLLIKLKTI